MTCGIYKITFNDDGRCYVGQAVDIERRWYVHRRELDGGEHHSPHLQRAWDKYGENSFTFELLEEVHPPTLFLRDLKSLLTEREQFWMDMLQPEFNSAPIAGSQLGYKFSPEACARMSASQRALWESPEHREKMRRLRESVEFREKQSDAVRALWEDPEYRMRQSEAHKGQRTSLGVKRTPEQIAKVRAARALYYETHPGPMTGRSHSPETRAKISESKRNPSPETRARLREAAARRWASPQARAAAGRIPSADTRERMSAKKREQWQDPEYRSMMLEAQRRRRANEAMQRNADDRRD